MKPFYVIIPYLASEAQGNELELAVEGWRKHCMDPFKIIIAGDDHPITKSGKDITYVRVPRISTDGRYYFGKDQYLPHLDMLNKYLRAMPFTCEADFEKSGFVAACDDMYAIRDFSLEDVCRLKINGLEMYGSYTAPNAWLRDKQKTKDTLIGDNKPVVDYTTHLPVWYDWRNLLLLVREYKMTVNSYVLEDLYFNTYEDSVGAIELDWLNYRDQWRLRIDDPSLKGEDIDTLVRRFDPIWLYNSTSGWSAALEEYINTINNLKL